MDIIFLVMGSDWVSVLVGDLLLLFGECNGVFLWIGVRLDISLLIELVFGWFFFGIFMGDFVIVVVSLCLIV